MTIRAESVLNCAEVSPGAAFSPGSLCSPSALLFFWMAFFFLCTQPGIRLQTGEMKMSSHLLRRRSSWREMEEKRREIKQK